MKEKTKSIGILCCVFLANVLFITGTFLPLNLQITFVSLGLLCYIIAIYTEFSYNLFEVLKK